MPYAKISRLFRSSPTDAERGPWKRLRLIQLGGYKFRRQYVIGPFIEEFVCLERRLVVEVDGGQYAGARSGYDAERTRWMQSHGDRVLLSGSNDVLRES